MFGMFDLSKFGQADCIFDEAPVQVMNLLSNGITLERPYECPNELFEVMKECWTLDPEKRPRFVDIQPTLESIRGLPHFQVGNSFHSQSFATPI